MAKSTKKFRKLSFIKSAVLEKDYPNTGLKEIAIAGRSNSGKSSLINAWAQSKIAKVSQVPGKTRLLNFFQMGDGYVLVDMPGYGWAARSISEMDTWNKMIEEYLRSRDQMVGLVLLMDIARDWSKDEAMLVHFLHENNVDVAIALTKSDKLKRHEIERAVAHMQKKAKTDAVFAVSSQDGHGVMELEDFIYRSWIKET